MSVDSICIKINGISHPVLCAMCKSEVSFVGETDGKSGEAGCSKCANIADVHEVAAMAVEYAKDEGQLIINRMARDAARKSKFMTFKGQTSHDKAHRFIVDLKI